MGNIGSRKASPYAHHKQRLVEEEVGRKQKQKQDKCGVFLEADTVECSLCRKDFKFLDHFLGRRRHCCFCGKCICQQCSMHDITNKPERICDECHVRKTQPKMFGIHIHSMDDQDGRTPYPMRRFLSWIQFLRENGLRTEGIFRKPGDHSRIKAMRELCESKETVDDSDLQDEIDKTSVEDTVYLVASMMKMFLREINGGLMSMSMCHVMRQHLSLESKNGAALPPLKWCSSFVNSSSAQFYIITTLFSFLHEVTRHSDSNRMSASSLAVCFAPSIFEELKTPQASGKNKAERISGKMRLMQQFFEASETFNSIATLLIKRAPEIFT